MIQKAMTASASLVCQQPLLCVPVDGKIGLSLQTLGRGTDALSARAHRFHWRGLALPPVAAQYSRAPREESARTSVQKSTYGAAIPDSRNRRRRSHDQQLKQ